MKFLLLTATMLTAMVPASADARRKPAPPPPPPVVRVVPSDPVEAFYFHHNDAPLWFRSPAHRAAAMQLPEILRRAQIEGLVEGPQLAAQVQAALAQPTVPGTPAAKAVETTLSRAWVRYVQAIKTPPKGVLFGYPQLAPQGARADQILLTASAAPVLAQHLANVSDINPVYKQMRDAAWAGFQADPAGGVDPRLMSNLERARVLPAGGRYVLVDAATQRLTMFENGRPVDSMKVIVGTAATPTPMIASIIHYVTLNPYWNVPGNLIRKTVAPAALKQGQGYLKPRGYEVMSGWTKDATVLPASEVDWKAVLAGQDIRVRQLPGAGNSMGKMKFPFPSGQDIYLHDTPSREHFAKSQRSLSNGCVRLEDAKRLGQWLLGRPPVAPTADPEQFVQLPQGVPIYLTYLTAQVQDGKLAYLDDIYGWDGRPDRQVAAATQITPAR